MPAKKKKHKRNRINQQNNSVSKNNDNDNIDSLQNVPPSQGFSLFKLIKVNIPLLIVFLVISLIVFSPLFGSEFISADDKAAVVENPQTRDVVGSYKSLFLTNIHQSTWYMLFNGTTTGFRLFAMAAHSINAFMVFLLVYRLYNEKSALITSFIFLVHPAISEALNWISAWGYLYNGLFTFSTLLLFTEYRKTNLKKYLYASVGMFIFAAAIYRSPWVATIPLVLFVMDFTHLINADNFKLNIPFKKLFSDYWLFVVGSLIYGFFVVYQSYVTRLDAFGDLYFNPEEADPLSKRVPFTVYRPLELLTFPLKLTLFHEGQIISPTYFNTMIAVTIIFVLATIFLFIKKKYRLSGNMANIYVALIPAFSPVVIAWFAAERYIYVSALFFILIFSQLLIRIEKSLIPKFALVATIIIVAVFGIRTYIRAGDFKNDKTIWQATLKTSPLSYRVYNNLGDVYTREGNYELAIQMFAESVRLKPDYADAVYNIGYVYSLMNDFPKAVEVLNKSIEMNPRLFNAYYVLGIIAYKQQDFDTAIAYVQKTLEINPNYLVARQALEELYMLKQQKDQGLLPQIPIQQGQTIQEQVPQQIPGQIPLQGQQEIPDQKQNPSLLPQEGPVPVPVPSQT